MDRVAGIQSREPPHPPPQPPPPPPSSREASALVALLLRCLAVAEGVGHVANQSQVLLEADLPIAVLVQASLHLLDGGGAVCVLGDKHVTLRHGTEEKNANPMAVVIVTAMTLPRLEDTIFWKDLLSRLAFPLELFMNVVTSSLMASSMSASAETGTKTSGRLASVSHRDAHSWLTVTHFSYYSVFSQHKHEKSGTGTIPL